MPPLSSSSSFSSRTNARQPQTTASSSRRVGVNSGSSNNQRACNNQQQRNAFVPGMSIVTTSSSTSYPNSANPSPRTSTSNPRSRQGSLNNNSISRFMKQQQQQKFTTKDLEELNQQYLVLRNKRLNDVLPQLRQRQNDVLEITSETARLVHEKNIEYHLCEKELHVELENKDREIGSVHQKIQEKRNDLEMAKKKKTSISEEEVKTLEELERIKAEGDALKDQIDAVDKEIIDITQKRDAADKRTRELLLEKEKQKMDTDSLRQAYEDAEDDLRIAEQIYGEKKSVLVDLEKKIEALKKHKKHVLASNR